MLDDEQHLVVARRTPGAAGQRHLRRKQVVEAQVAAVGQAVGQVGDDAGFEIARAHGRGRVYAARGSRGVSRSRARRRVRGGRRDRARRDERACAFVTIAASCRASDAPSVLRRMRTAALVVVPRRWRCWRPRAARRRRASAAPGALRMPVAEPADRWRSAARSRFRRIAPSPTGARSGSSPPCCPRTRCTPKHDPLLDPRRRTRAGGVDAGAVRVAPERNPAHARRRPDRPARHRPLVAARLRSVQAAR